MTDPQWLIARQVVNGVEVIIGVEPYLVQGLAENAFARCGLRVVGQRWMRA